MKILGINGSHRAGKGTAGLLKIALDEAAALGAETELIELSECDIQFCTGCNRCMAKPCCSIDDDMTTIMEKMKEADGIIVASPNYFSDVSARTKNFMDRTRCMHMVENALKGKVGGIITTTGLNNCGVEHAMATIERFFTIHEMWIVHPRPEGPVLGFGTSGSQWAGREDGKVKWRRISDDDVAAEFCQVLGRDMVEACKKLA